MPKEMATAECASKYHDNPQRGNKEQSSGTTNGACRDETKQAPDTANADDYDNRGNAVNQSTRGHTEEMTGQSADDKANHGDCNENGSNGCDAKQYSGEQRMAMPTEPNGVLEGTLHLGDNISEC